MCDLVCLCISFVPKLLSIALNLILKCLKPLDKEKNMWVSLQDFEQCRKSVAIAVGSGCLSSSVFSLLKNNSQHTC